MRRYSRHNPSYTQRGDNPAMTSVRVGSASRRRGSSGIEVRRMPVRSRRRPRRDTRGKLLVACMLVVGFLAASYFACNSVSSIAPAIGSGGTTASASTTSTPKSEWRRGVTPTLYQIDPQWAAERYANDTIGESGCGPTCLSMVYANLTGRTEMDPVKMCAYSERGGYVEAGATSWTFMTNGAAGLGLRAEELAADATTVKARVASGHPVIAILGPGDFTTTGHFIVICGLDGNGKVVIRDPNSAENTNRAWDLDKILRQARNLWAYSA